MTRDEDSDEIDRLTELTGGNILYEKETDVEILILPDPVTPAQISSISKSTPDEQVTTKLIYTTTTVLCPVINQPIN